MNPQYSQSNNCDTLSDPNISLRILRLPWRNHRQCLPGETDSFILYTQILSNGRGMRLRLGYATSRAIEMGRVWPSILLGDLLLPLGSSHRNDVLPSNPLATRNAARVTRACQPLPMPHSTRAQASSLVFFFFFSSYKMGGHCTVDSSNHSRQGCLFNNPKINKKETSKYRVDKNQVNANLHFFSYRIELSSQLQSYAHGFLNNGQ